MLFAIALGTALALADNRLHNRITFGSVIIGMGLVWSSMLYESDFQYVVITMRGVLLLWVAVRLVSYLRRRHRPFSGWGRALRGRDAPPSLTSGSTGV
jgi:hypothetical protein